MGSSGWKLRVFDYLLQDQKRPASIGKKGDTPNHSAERNGAITVQNVPNHRDRKWTAPTLPVHDMAGQYWCGDTDGRRYLHRYRCFCRALADRSCFGRDCSDRACHCENGSVPVSERSRNDRRACETGIAPKCNLSGGSRRKTGRPLVHSDGARRGAWKFATCCYFAGYISSQKKPAGRMCGLKSTFGRLSPRASKLPAPSSNGTPPRITPPSS